MAQFFDPSPEERQALEALADEIPAIQQALVNHHALLTMPDRGAHQQQLAGSKALFTAAGQLPRELDGLGIIRRSSGRSRSRKAIRTPSSRSWSRCWRPSSGPTRATGTKTSTSARIFRPHGSPPRVPSCTARAK